MLFEDYKKSYVEFCNEEIIRRIISAKRKYLREEKLRKKECILNEEDEQGVEKFELLVDDSSDEFEESFSLFDNAENPNIVESRKLLSPIEQKVVSLRFKDLMSIEEIKIEIGCKRSATPSEICCRAVKKIKKNIDDKN
mgnify:CR=1 FL=1